MLRFILTALTCFTIGYTSLAQDANYWTSSYGPAGFFTPGAVIANNRDSGTLFYNPALQAYNRHAAASISGTIYRLETVKIKDGLGTGLNLNSTATLIIPLIASHTIKLKTEKPISLVYAIVNTPIINYQATQRKDQVMNVLNDSYSPGAETFIGQYTASNIINETSLFLSGGYKISQKFAAGLSMEGQFRKQNYQQDFTSYAIQNSGSGVAFPPVTSVGQFYQVNFYTMGLRFKGGISYDMSDKNHLGVIVTSPLMSVYGKGVILSNVEINNLNLSGVNLNLLANTRQTKAKSAWKDPVSFAVGFTHEFENATFYIVSEYFTKLKEYSVVTPKDQAYVRPDTGTRVNIDQIKFKDARNAILNVGIGVSMQVKPGITAYTSLRTDFNYSSPGLYKNTDGFEANTTSWDDYHAQLGINMKKPKFNVRAGVLLTYGSTNEYLQPLNYDDPKEENLLMGEPHNVKATHFSIGFIFSYIHSL